MDNKTFFERTGGILIVICIIALLGAFFFSCVLFVKSSVQDVNVQIVMPVDSTGVISSEALQQAEDLKAELVRHEQLLEDRYKHVLEQKENMNDMLTIGGMFLTIVLALFGFFGYKSMSSIEEKVKQDAKKAAEDTAKEETKTQFSSYATKTTESLSTDMGQKVKETGDKEMAEARKVSKGQMEAFVKEQVSDVTNKVKDAEDRWNGVSSSVGNLDEKLSLMDDRLKRLESMNSHPSTERRTLVKGGKNL